MLSMRPAETEFESFYAGYVARIEDGRLLDTLAAQPAELRALLLLQDEDEASLPSAQGKWSLKDVINHMIDAERVFACRLLWFARQPGADLPGFDQDAWVPAAVAHRRTLSDLFDEFDAVRGATATLLRSLPADAAARGGRANGHPVTVRALAWIIAGHAQHHLDLLRERYAGQV
jgi:uncharacterized damage-inducible protein DinB